MGNQRGLARFQTLRQLAEAMLHIRPSEGMRYSLEQHAQLMENMYRLLHELELLYTEMEMQYEELCCEQDRGQLSDRYTSLYEVAPVGYITTSEDGQIVEVNLTGGAMLGSDRHTLRNRKVSEFVLAEDQDIYYLHRRRLTTMRTPQACELRLRRSDGSSFHARLESTPDRHASTPPQYWTVVSDVSDRVRQQVAQQERDVAVQEQMQQRIAHLEAALQREHLRAEVSGVCLEHHDVPAMLYQVAQRVVERMATLCMITLYQDGRLLPLIVAHQDAAREDEVRTWVEHHLRELGAQHPAVQVMRSQRPLYRPQLAADDGYTWLPPHIMVISACITVPLYVRAEVLGTLSFLSDQGGPRYTMKDLALVEELAGRVGRVIDDANLAVQGEQARAAAEVAVQARDAMCRSLAHDLRTPLGLIQGYVSLLQDHFDELHAASAAECRSYCALIELGVAQIDRQLEAMLDLAALQAGQPLMLQRTAVDLVPLVRRVLATYQQTTSHHELRLECVEPGMSITGDERRLERMLNNLVTNAIKYSPQGGVIVVTLVEERHEGRAGVLLSVRDQGIGIVVSDLPHLFTPFRRGSNVPPGVAGTGLGLASVQQIVAEHGGTVAVSSAKGEGTTVSVWLPFYGRPVAH